MKSLVLKDLYNIGHNAKSLVFMLIVLTVAIVPTSGVGGYLVMCTILCSMMTITTFTFDDQLIVSPQRKEQTDSRGKAAQVKGRRFFREEGKRISTVEVEHDDRAHDDKAHKATGIEQLVLKAKQLQHLIQHSMV